MVSGARSVRIGVWLLGFMMACCLSSRDSHESVDVSVPVSQPIGEPPVPIVARVEPDSVVKPPAAGCPVEMVLIAGAYCPRVDERCRRWMDPPSAFLPHHRCSEFEVPTRCLSAVREPRRFCVDRDEYADPSSELPRNHVSWTEASRLCQQQGKRLCLESEWMLACEGEQMLPYPTGYVRPSQICNFDRSPLVTARGRMVDYRLPVGQSHCLSPYGVRDLVGNIDEWTQREEKWAANRSALKGGWWLAGRNRCRPATTGHDELYHDVQTGFRCCRDVRQPESVPMRAGGE